MNGQDIIFILGIVMLGAVVGLIFYVTKLTEQVRRVESQVNEFRIFQLTLERLRSRR